MQLRIVLRFKVRFHLRRFWKISSSFNIEKFSQDLVKLKKNFSTRDEAMEILMS